MLPLQSQRFIKRVDSLFFITARKFFQQMLKHFGSLG